MKIASLITRNKDLVPSKTVVPILAASSVMSGRGQSVGNLATKSTASSFFNRWPFRWVSALWTKRYGGLHFRLADINCIVYMALVGAVLPFFHEHVPFWPRDFAIHIFLVVGALEIVRLGQRHSQNKIVRAVRTFYPALYYAYGWNEMGHLVRMFSGSFSAIDMIVNLDLTLFGGHPTVWVQQLYRPWLDELMNICYSGYYFFAPVVLISLYWKGKQDRVLAALSITTFTYFTNFILFFIFPSLGPRMIVWMQTLYITDYTGYLAASFTRFVQANGSIPGGAFPSSHVAGAVAWALVAWRYNRKLGYLLVPLVPGVAFSTVYLRFHHAVDPITGVILGFICSGIALSILKRRGEDPVIVQQ